MSLPGTFLEHQIRTFPGSQSRCLREGQIGSLGDILPGDQYMPFGLQVKKCNQLIKRQMIQQAKFTYSPLSKAFEKQIKTIEDH